MKKFEKPVDKNQAFHLATGKVLTSLKELYEEILNMSEDVFNHHVTSHKNDFSKWVKDVFGEKTLSAKMAKAVSPSKMKEVLASVIVSKKTTAAKAATKTVSKTPAKKAAPKAAVKKAAAKPEVKKVTAKKVTVKPAAAKPAVKKVAAKPVAKKVAAKPAPQKAK